MTTTVFRLGENFQPRDVVAWYGTATLGEAITLTLPSRSATVQLICRDNGYLHWWPAGGRGVTVPLDNAIQRLAMLQNVPPTRAEQHPHRAPQALCP